MILKRIQKTLQGKYSLKCFAIYSLVLNPDRLYSLLMIRFTAMAVTASFKAILYRMTLFLISLYTTIILQ